ncbi:HNH endonuclease signature motif containing protein [Heyndrickxia acidicola]|uniref:HNH endonuclease signature motif containing protein n=1 Tax=Heyndrickxia acidicola TaxID=209389 RepID=A0ABU6MC15_9BACI|nr:HNH endonuclease signature motif containing protein [Heyndrickxia acidicola]MED1201969.1 HNH endonuclease signature motif containing protein [Heyndrickxia acidicola]
MDDWINDLIMFLIHLQQMKVKVKKEDLLGALCFVENYQQFKSILALYKDYGLKMGIKIYESLPHYICDYNDCLEILDYLKENSKGLRADYFIQLILLSQDREKAEKAYKDAQIFNIKLAESWIDRYDEKNTVHSNFFEIQKQRLSYYGKPFMAKIKKLKQEIATMSISTVKKQAENNNRKGTVVYSQNHYYRSEFVKQYALKVAKGVCQLCRRPAPFLNKDYNPFLEVHHIDYLSKGGKDRIDNVIAICPNCHRRVHVLEDNDDYIKLKYRANLLLKIY